ncbi:response regulator receiver sensor signal transduction histidine kinase [Calothrix sp. NIES-4071]|nr:response regulator receiver sensor signal transduction histidine kinase [Calothrix sp. NIES-4071]BAZ59777.1 response regulator receiver sensor signal transduction histidine kinase [Calothrix sp. NIES-4105]
MQGKCCTDFKTVTNSNSDYKSCLHPSELLVLVVDSNIDNLELTSRLISYYGFQVMTATNSQTALEIFQEYQPAMVLVELMLPDVDGLDFGRCVRASANSAPIIALTSLPSHLFYEQTLRAGFNGYIEKPFEFETLEHVLTRCLNLPPSLS